jgi:hypothetical protein
MYVVRLRSIDGTLKFGAFISRSLAQSITGRDQVVNERLDESRLFDVASVDAPNFAAGCVSRARLHVVETGKEQVPCFSTLFGNPRNRAVEQDTDEASTKFR